MSCSNIQNKQVYVSIEPTTTCNLNCPYCYVSYLNTVKLISKSVWTFFKHRLKKIKKKYPNKELYIDFLGGEPLTLSQELLNEKIEDMLDLHILGVVDIFSITSNGLIYKDLKLLKKFKKSMLNISVHPFNFLKNFDSLFFNLKTYNEENIQMFINFYIDDVLTKEHKEKIELILDFLNENDIKYRFIPIFKNDVLFDIFSCGISEEKMFKYISKNYAVNAKYNKKQFNCTPNVFDININGDIIFSCSYNLKQNLNIKNHDIPVNKKVICDENFCTSYDGDKTNVNKYLL